MVDYTKQHPELEAKIVAAGEHMAEIGASAVTTGGFRLSVADPPVGLPDYRQQLETMKHNFLLAHGNEDDWKKLSEKNFTDD
jgi:hypothetical protein